MAVNYKNNHRKEWTKSFGNNLARIIFERGSTQKRIAIKSGISEGTISKYVHGEQDPSLYAAVQIANALECGIDNLVNFKFKHNN